MGNERIAGVGAARNGGDGMIGQSEYLNYLQSKIEIASETGFNISLDEINPILKPHQRMVLNGPSKAAGAHSLKILGLVKHCRSWNIAA